MKGYGSRLLLIAAITFEAAAPVLGDEPPPLPGLVIRLAPGGIDADGDPSWIDVTTQINGWPAAAGTPFLKEPVVFAGVPAVAYQASDLSVMDASGPVPIEGTEDDPDEGGFLYSSDSYADDLPYWINGPKGPHLIVPYTLDANDMRFINAQGFGSGDEFFTYLRDAFDLLHAEGERAPKMMSVGLHCRLVGRPGRAAALARFLDHVGARERVRIATRLDIARHWHREHRASAAGAPTIA